MSRKMDEGPNIGGELLMNLKPNLGMAKLVAVALLLTICVSAAASRWPGPPGQQFPPGGRIPPVCFGQGFADLQLDRDTVAVGERVVLTLTEEPGAPVALLVDSGMGPVTFPAVGTFCLDFGPDQRTLVNGIRRGGSARTDDQGVFVYSLRIPNRPSLRGRSIYLQGVVETVNAPNGIAITPLRVVTIEP